MLRVKHLSKSYGPYTALADASFNLGKGQKAALVGPNGVGKSTLLRILAGKESQDAGVVNVPQGAEIAYLPQEIEIDGQETIGQYLKRVTGVSGIENRLKELEADLSGRDKLREYGDLQEKYRRIGGYNFDHRVSVFISGFGLGKSGDQSLLSGLSGGQKTKVAIIGILLGEPDLLLLDEPTNNLDLPALLWMEEFLRRSQSAALIVSHDRRFLDVIVSKVFEIDWMTHAIKDFPGTYSEFLEFKEKELQRIKEEYARQQEEIQGLQESAEEQKQWAREGAHQTVSDNNKMLQGFRRDRAAKAGSKAKAIEKRVEQMEKVDKPEERKPLEIPLSPEKRGFGQIEIDEAVAAYPGSDFKLGPVSVVVPAGSRVALLGANGSGKSTLLKLISGEIRPQRGEVRVSPSLAIGSFMQSHENLPPDETVSGFLTREAGISKQDCYNLLSKFNLAADKVGQQIRSLSPGERARVILALFAARGVNTLLLDEPTNHLDLEALEALEEVLSGYQGTVVVVSHDRRFLEKIKLNHVFVLENGSLSSVTSIDSYVDAMVRQAKRLIRLL